MSLKKSLEKILIKARENKEGNFYREWIDLFKKTQEDYERNFRFMYATIKTDGALSKKYKDFQDLKLKEYKEINNPKLLADHEIELLTLVEFCNLRKNRVLTAVWRDYFGWDMMKAFRF